MKAYAKKFANIFFSFVLILGLMPILPCQQAYAVAETDYSEAAYNKADGLIVVYNNSALDITEESGGSSLSGNDSLGEIGVVDQEEVDAKTLTDGSVTVVKVSDDTSLKEVASEIESLPEVAYVQPNFEYDLLTTEVTDPYAQGSGDSSSNQYYLSSIGAYKAWDYAKANNKVTVAVLDTGVNLKHPDLAVNIDIQNAYDITTMTALSSSGVANNGDANGHGTLVAGVIAAQTDNAEGIAGVSYNATVLPVKVFDNNDKTTTADLIAAYGYLDELIDSGKTDNLRVINLSLGYYSDTQTESDKALQDAIKTMRNENGVLTVCAGGNSSSNSPCYPSDFDECLSVASLNEDGSLVSGGSGKDIAAYGVNVLSTNASASYSCASGTSMAAPQVAASAALLWAADSSLSVSEVVNTLTSSSNKDVASVGALDVFAAVGNVLGIDVADSDVAETELSNQDESGNNEVSGEEDSSDDWDKANSWRYKDGKPIENLVMDSGDIQPFATYSGPTWNKSNGNSYTYYKDGSPITVNVNGVNSIGIDVSSWQGDIDWAKVKADGIDYAIIRIRTYNTSSKTSKIDPYFIKNVRGCIDNGIPFGVYIYSYESSVSGASKEADLVLSYLSQAGLSPSNLDLPVYYDLEQNSLASTAYRSLLGSMATTFCNKIESAGYDVGIYANVNWFTNYLTDSAFSNPNWHRWVAGYYWGRDSVSDLVPNTEIWQFSEQGTVNGINGNVAMNFGTNNIGCAHISVQGLDRHYTGKALAPTVKIKIAGKELTEGIDYKLLYNNSESKPVDEGTYSIVAQGMGEYEGTVSLDTMNINNAIPDSLTNNIVFRNTANNNLVLDAKGASPKSGAAITAWTINGGKNQKWKLELQDDGYYVVRNVANPNLVLDAKGASPKSGAAITAWEYNGGLNQKWAFVEQSDGSYVIRNAANTNLVLDAAGASPKSGAAISAWTANGGKNQKWTIEEYITDISDASVGAYGMYRNYSGKALSVSPVITLGNEILSEGEDYTLLYNGSSTKPTNKGSYSVTAKGVGSYRGNVFVGTMTIYDQVSDSSTKKYSFRNVANSNLVLDAAGASPKSGAVISAWTANGGKNQKWTLELQDDGYYVVRNVANPNLVLDAKGTSPKSGATITAWEYNGGLNQKWAFVKQSDGSYVIRNAATKTLVLDAAGGTPKSGAAISAWVANGGKNQKWTLV